MLKKTVSQQTQPIRKNRSEVYRGVVGLPRLLVTLDKLPTGVDKSSLPSVRVQVQMAGLFLFFSVSLSLIWVPTINHVDDVLR